MNINEQVFRGRNNFALKETNQQLEDFEYFDTPASGNINELMELCT